jgi:HEAT repeats
MSRIQLLLAVLCLGAPMATTPANAWGLGISIGIPLYAPPYYPYYYRPYPYYYAPAPVVVAPGPYVYQPAPAPAIVQSAPAPSYAPVPSANVQAPPPTVAAAPSTVVQANNSQTASRVEQLLQQLSSTQEHVRRDATLDLGRMRASRAAEPLTRILAGDASPVVREAAARALGLIASPQTLNALILAAQVDTDRDVRHSAQFAVEIIRANLRAQ